MNILLCEEVSVDSGLPDGRYACMYQHGDVWKATIIEVKGGQPHVRLESKSGGGSSRGRLRTTFRLLLDEKVETLILRTDRFAEVHGVVCAGFAGNFRVEPQTDIPHFPVELS